jgi:ribosomal protein S17
MAVARIPRFCASISSIDNFTMSSTHTLSRGLAPRSQVLSSRCRARPQRPVVTSSSCKFSTTTTKAPASIDPLLQETTATKRREDTLQEHSATAPHIAAKKPAPHASSTPSSNAHASVAQPTLKASVTPSQPPSPSSTRPASDLDFLATSRHITGTVIRTHTMAKTVAVSTNRQYFDRFLQKHYTKPSKTLVHDPNETLVEGDVIEYGLFPPAERRERIQKGKGKRVKYVVRGVVTPFGVPLDQRVPRGDATPERLKS